MTIQKNSILPTDTHCSPIKTTIVPTYQSTKYITIFGITISCISLCTTYLYYFPETLINLQPKENFYGQTGQTGARIEILKSKTVHNLEVEVYTPDVDRENKNEKVEDYNDGIDYYPSSELKIDFYSDDNTSSETSDGDLSIGDDDDDDDDNDDEDNLFQTDNTYDSFYESSYQFNYNFNASSIVIGISTGRSGTLAFSKLLSNQFNTCISHEYQNCNNFEWKYGFRPELNNIARNLTQNRLNVFDKRCDGISGDIASWNLPYAENFLELSGKVKIVALKRKREDCIDSWIKWTDMQDSFMWSTRKQLLTNINYYNYSDYWSKCFPKFKFKNPKNFTKQEAVEKYYDYYNSKIDQLIEKYPNRVRLYDSYEVLNEPRVAKDIFKWLGIGGPYDFSETDTEGHQMDLGRMLEIKGRYYEKSRNRTVMSPLPDD